MTKCPPQGALRRSEPPEVFWRDRVPRPSPRRENAAKRLTRAQTHYARACASSESLVAYEKKRGRKLGDLSFYFGTAWQASGGRVAEEGGGAAATEEGRRGGAGGYGRRSGVVTGVLIGSIIVSGTKRKGQNVPFSVPCRGEASRHLGKSGRSNTPWQTSCENSVQGGILQ